MNATLVLSHDERATLEDALVVLDRVAKTLGVGLSTNSAAACAGLFVRKLVMPAEATA